MSNVLPLETRRAVWRQYRARLLMAASLVAFVLALVALLALSPGYLILRTAEQDLASAEAATTGPSRDDVAAIARAKFLVAQLSPVVARSSPSSLVADALAARGQGIVIDQISYTAGSPATLVLAGNAKDTVALNTYQNALRGLPGVSGVSVPLGDLAGAGDGAFTITLSGAF